MVRLLVFPLVWTACFAVTMAPLGLEAHPFLPGEPEKKPVALVGGTVHTGTGQVIPGGTVLFHQGRVVAVGRKVEIPADAKIIRLRRHHVYPGLFDPWTNLGLVEIPAVRATRDQSETGSINPNVQAHVAFNPDSHRIPVTRANGVLLCLSAPRGGLLSGRASVMMLDGWTWEDMLLRPDVGLVLQWPSAVPALGWFRRNTPKPRLDARAAELKRLHEAFDQARRYLQAWQARGKPDVPPHDYDARWHAMLPVLQGKMPVLVRADEQIQIQEAVAFARRYGLRLIVVGGYDAPRCAALLKENNVPVIVTGVLRLPRYRHDPYDTPFTVPARLHAAGVAFCISGNEREGNVRNLPYHAAMAAAFGLPREVAVQSITQFPARILGVDQRVGTLAPGRDATLIVTTGDVLEIPSQVVRAWIQGRSVSLESKHTQLWKKFREKYRRLQKRQKANSGGKNAS